MSAPLSIALAGPSVGALVALVLVHRALVREREERIRNVAGLAARLQQLLEVPR